MPNHTNAPAVMIQGTGSNVGKSLICAGLCRLYARRGLKVAPFKPQNMSNNAAATSEGGEIGRAQALQARAACQALSVHMNPILLKPESETGSQIIVQGHRWATLKARDYGKRKHELMPAVLDSFARLKAQADLVIVEGAGSPAEVNLRAGDIANMGFAAAADLPVVLVGDIDRGGVIASLVGCHAVLEPDERARVEAFLINRFRGDPTLFADGMTIITDRTGWSPLGIVPFFPPASDLPAEDSVDLDTPAQPRSGEDTAPIRIVALRLPRIANFDDLDPIRLEPDVDLQIIAPGTPIPGNADLVILPGSKATVSDLEALKASGWDIDLKAHVRRGGAVLGLCGGYQMLGQTIADPRGLEGRAGTHDALGFLNVKTELGGDKMVRPVTGHDPESGIALEGYEIHLGRTDGPDCASPVVMIGANSAARPDGARSPDGLIAGTYLHGLFLNDQFRAAFLARLKSRTGASIAYDARVESALDALADHLETHVNLTALDLIAGLA